MSTPHSSLRSKALFAAIVAVALVAPPTMTARAAGPRPVSRTTGYSRSPQVESDDFGNTVVVWSYDDGTHPERIMGRSLGEPIYALSQGRPDASNPELALNDAGHGFAVWRYSDGSNSRIAAREIIGVGTFGSPLTLSPAGEDASPPQVAVNADGDAFVVWRSRSGGSTRIRERTVSANRIAGPLRTLSASASFAAEPTVATEPNGDGIAAWVRSAGPSDQIEERRISPASQLRATVPLSPVGQVSDPRLAGDGSGDPFVAWVAGSAQADVIRARAISGSTPGPTRTLSRPRVDSGSPQIAAAGDRAMIVWDATVDQSTFSHRAEARSLTASGDPGPLLTLRASGPSAVNMEPHVAMNADRTAFADWEETRQPESDGDPLTYAPAGCILAGDSVGDISLFSAPSQVPAPGPTIAIDATEATPVWTEASDTRSVVYSDTLQVAAHSRLR